MKNAKSTVVAGNVFSTILKSAIANPILGTSAPAAAVAAATVTAPISAKPSTKPVSAAAKPKAKAFVNPIKFIVKGDGATKLFAHTAAWLELSGLIHGGEYPAEFCAKLGGSAYSYHKAKGNFSESQGMAKLTVKGLEKFQAREQGTAQGFAAEDKDHYMLMMLEGLNDERLIKNASAIMPMPTK